MIISKPKVQDACILLIPKLKYSEMHVLIFDIWMTVSDYNNTNPTVIILVGPNWNLAEMHVLFV
jgi:hypothetical protein